jgi:hypothetical protein
MPGDHNSAERMRLMQAAFLLVLALCWAWVAADGRFHWDEPGYWYTAAYFSVPDILAGTFQPSGIDGFSNSRVGHILLLKALNCVFGPGPATLALMIAAYLAMLAMFLWLTYRLLQTLSAGVRYTGAAVVACALTPIFVYLAFKTVAEIPALFLSALAALAFVRSLRERPVLWLAIVVIALAGVAFTKNHIALLPASMIVALMLSGGLGYSMRKIVVHAVAAGLASLAIFAGVLFATGIPLERYLAVLTFVAHIADPISVRLVTLALECGPVLLVMPFAFMSPSKLQLRFFGLWFLLATVPLLLSTRIEDRYLIANLVPMAGLAQVSFEGFNLFVRSRSRVPERSLIGAGVLGAFALLALSALEQPLMLHGVRSDRLSVLLQRLDALYGAGRYTIVTPSEYTTFLYLRFMYPERAVYTVFTPAPPNHRDPREWALLQQQYYGARAVQNLQALHSVPGPIVYVSPDANPTVATLQDALEHLPNSAPRRLGEGVLAKMHPGRPDAMSWMRSDPHVALCVVEQTGHYVAWQVRLDPDAGRGVACS